jgi:hypothetical protein
MDKCGRCGKSLEPLGGVSVAGVGERCHDCFNVEAAARLGVDFDRTPIEPVVIADADGVPHTFQIRSRMIGTGHAMDAIETPRPERGGYFFRVLGDVQADAWEILQRLYAKMRREMAVRHVERGDHGWQIGPADRLVGRIEWDRDTDGATPLLIVDGRPFTWEEVGRMLMSFEGFTLDARIEESIEVVGDGLQSDSRRGSPQIPRPSR